MATRTLTTPDTFEGYPTGSRIPMHEVQDHARRSGSHWFDPKTMRGFGSRVPNVATIGPDGRAYFVSSEQDARYDRTTAAWGGERRYTLRAYNPASGSVEDVERLPDGAYDPDAFGRYRSLQTATAALRRFLDRQP